MEQTLPFEGFDRFIAEPLRHDDPASFQRIASLFIAETRSRNNPFAYIIQALGGHSSLSERDAMRHWDHIMVHKKDMEAKLGRKVFIQTALIDYFSIVGTADPFTVEGPSSAAKKNGDGRDEWLDRIYSPTYYQERLKEEVSRAKRYSHALSAIMIDVDEFHKINEEFSYKVGDDILTLIVKILKRTVRSVDFIARYSGDVLLIVLPNTNKREAVDLAERIRQNIAKRARRSVPALTRDITVTLSVGQCEKDEHSVQWMLRLAGLLASGKKKKRNMVYSE